MERYRGFLQTHTSHTHFYLENYFTSPSSWVPILDPEAFSGVSLSEKQIQPSFYPPHPIPSMRFGGTWDIFPSDDSLSLSLTDPVVHNLRSKAISRENHKKENRIEWVKARRTQQAQALARRKAERETVENVSISLKGV